MKYRSFHIQVFSEFGSKQNITKVFKASVLFSFWFRLSECTVMNSNNHFVKVGQTR